MMDYDEGELDKIILDADKNGDGQIDFEEFFAMMQEGTRMRKEGRSDTYTDLVGVPAERGEGRDRTCPAELSAALPQLRKLPVNGAKCV